jgi:O-antigen/teichoic acid export membrane protein
VKLHSLLGARILGSALQIILIVLLARSATVLEFGVFSSLFAIFSFACSLSDVGLSVLLPRFEIKRQSSKLHQALLLHRATLTLILLVTLASLVILGVFQSLIFSWVPLLFLGVYLEFHNETQLTLQIARGKDRSVAFSILIRRAFALTFFMSWLVLEIPSPLTGASVALLAAGIIGFTHLASKNGLKVPGKLSRKSVSELGREVLPLLPNQVLVTTKNLDLPIVATVAGASEAAAFGLGLRLSNPVSLLTSSLASLLLPKMVLASKVEAMKALKNLIKTSIVLSISLSPLFFVMSPLVDVLFGAKYSFAVPTIMAILIASPFVSITAPATAILLGQGLDKEASKTAAIYSGIFLLLVPLGAFLAGGIGAAAASLFAAVVRLSLTFIVLKAS